VLIVTDVTVMGYTVVAVMINLQNWNREGVAMYHVARSHPLPLHLKLETDPPSSHTIYAYAYAYASSWSSGSGLFPQDCGLLISHHTHHTVHRPHDT